MYFVGCEAVMDNFECGDEIAMIFFILVADITSVPIGRSKNHPRNRFLPGDAQNKLTKTFRPPAPVPGPQGPQLILPTMELVRNLFYPKTNRTPTPDEETTSLLSTHAEHHTLNPRLISDIILVCHPHSKLSNRV